MHIIFKNGYFIESSSSGYHVKYDTGRVKAVKRAGIEEKVIVPIIERIGSSSTMQGAATILADCKIKRIEASKISVIISEIEKVKKEIIGALTDNGFNFKIVKGK